MTWVWCLLILFLFFPLFTMYRLPRPKAGDVLLFVGAALVVILIIVTIFG